MNTDHMMREIMGAFGAGGWAEVGALSLIRLRADSPGDGQGGSRLVRCEVEQGVLEDYRRGPAALLGRAARLLYDANGPGGEVMTAAAVRDLLAALEDLEEIAAPYLEARRMGRLADIDARRDGSPERGIPCDIPCCLSR